MPRIFPGDLHAGLSGLELLQSSVDLGHGLSLSKTCAYLMTPFIMSSKLAPKSAREGAPWKAAAGGCSFSITAQLFVPASAEIEFGSRLDVARTVVFLLRLAVNPSITMPVFSDQPFAAVALKEVKPLLLSYEVQPRYLPLELKGPDGVDSIAWVSKRWQATHRLIGGSAEFALAVEAIDSGQFVRQTTLALLSLWGALESIFSPSTSELRFRVSALIAAFLEPPGSSRQESQKYIARLYDKRSAAAHGKPKHNTEDLLATFNLMRRVLMEIINKGEVPTKDALEAALFASIKV